MKNIREDAIIAETLQRQEEILVEFVKEMREGLAEKKLDINGIELMMLKTYDALKKGVVHGVNQLASEESKKKLLLAVAKDAERIRL